MTRTELLTSRPAGFFRRTLAPALLAGLLLQGCGGSGSHGSSGGGNSGTPVSGVTFQIAWPQRTKDALSTSLTSAMSVTVVVSKAAVGGGDISMTVDRSASDLTAHTETYTLNQPVAAKATTTLTFYSGAGGSGTVVGSATASGGLQGTSLGLTTLSASATIKTVTVVSTAPLTVGSAAQSLSFSAQDANGNAVAVSTGSARWTLASGGSFLTLTADGVATAIAAGTASVRVSVDGQTSPDASITVTAPVSVEGTLAQMSGWNSYNWFDHFYQNQYLPVFAKAQTLHSGWMRQPFYWDDYISDPDGSIARFKTMAADMRANGMQPLFVVIPSSSTYQVSAWPTTDTDRTHFVEFVTAIFKNISDVQVEIGSEPNWDAHDDATIDAYGTLVKAIGQAKRSQGLGGKLVAPSVVTDLNAKVNWLTFLNRFMPIAGDYVDLFCIHVYGSSSQSYDPEGQMLSSGSDQLTQFQNAIGGKPYIIGETGTDTNSVTEADQSSRLVRALLCVASRGVKECTVYELSDRSPTNFPGQDISQYHFGVLTSNLTPKKAYADIQKLMDRFGSYKVSSVTKVSANHYQAVLTNGSDTQTLKWCTDASTAGGEYPYNPVDSF